MVAPAVFVKPPASRWLDASAWVALVYGRGQLPVELLYADALAVALPHRILEVVVG